MYNEFRRCSLRFYIALLSILLLTQLPSISADNSRVKVYTPQKYKQTTLEQSPKYGRVYGEGIELLVDCSGSMTPWIKTVSETVNYILPKIPENTSVALRVFGERPSSYSYNVFMNEACKSTRLVTYFRQDNQSKIQQGMNDAKIGGMTPIEYALKEALKKDFKNLTVVSRGNPTGKRKKIILITDGDDTCGGDPCRYIKNTISQHRDLEIDVIKVGNANSLTCLTQITGGTFHTIDGLNDIPKFEQALEKAFKVPVGTIQEGRMRDPNLRREQGLYKPFTPQTQQTTTQQDDNTKPTRGYKFIQF